jgi:hypothetical protein
MTTSTTSARLAAGLVIVLAALAAAAAPASASGPDPKRAVAVFEYRAGSAALPEIDGRIASLLRKHTSLEIIDGDAARKTYGARLDADIVACAGEADCVAAIGAKAGAKEVLLVGVSEFGDVILTLQRIDVKRKKVAMRIAEALAETVEPDDDALLGYCKRVLPESDFLQFGTIRIKANLVGAEVLLGRDTRGQTPIEPIKVRAPATYDIKLTKAGYVPFSARVAVPPDGEVEVEARLTREGAGGAWYTKWWVAAIAGVVVAGGVGIGVWASQDDPTSVPVGGTID